MRGVVQEIQATTPVSFMQSDFTGGMNLFSDDTKLASNEYRQAFHIRVRDGSPTPTRKPNLINAPVGLKQGIYGFDTFFVLFVGGKAYYQVVGTNVWVNIVGFQMSDTAPVIYAQAVPSSTVNYGRVLQDASNFRGTSLNPGVSLLQNVTVNGLLAGLVCQDGVNQPWIIFSNKSSRVLQSYTQWSLDNREYVPIGKQMAYMNGILLIASVDGKSIYRSVSGRPCDFGVNIDITGNISGDATTVSYSVSYNQITCLYPLNSGQLFVGTTLGCYGVSFDYTNLVFGEPTFTNSPAFVAGCINQFAIQDILGDYAVVDYSNILSYNAVQQLKNEGRNAIFSKKIAKAIDGIIQDPSIVCSCIFDNYLLVSLQTAYGYAIVVYDTINVCWVSIDITPEPIKMLSVAGVQTNPTLYGISDNNIYQFFPSTGQNWNQCVFRPAACTSSDAKKQLRTQGFRCVFFGSDIDTNANVTELMDDRKGKTISRGLLSYQATSMSFPITYPILFASKSAIDNLYFNFEQFRQVGWKLSSFISWSSSASLLQVQVDAELDTCKVSQKQQISLYAS